MIPVLPLLLIAGAVGAGAWFLSRPKPDTKGFAPAGQSGVPAQAVVGPINTNTELGSLMARLEITADGKLASTTPNGDVIKQIRDYFKAHPGLRGTVIPALRAWISRAAEGLFVEGNDIWFIAPPEKNSMGPVIGLQPGSVIYRASYSSPDYYNDKAGEYSNVPLDDSSWTAVVEKLQRAPGLAVLVPNVRVQWLKDKDKSFVSAVGDGKKVSWIYKPYKPDAGVLQPLVSQVALKPDGQLQATSANMKLLSEIRDLATAERGKEKAEGITNPAFAAKYYVPLYIGMALLERGLQADVADATHMWVWKK
jgi:hypothetical protein